MNLIEATTYCFRNALKFSGRADRYEFWNFIVFIVVVSVALVIVNTIVFGPTVEEGISLEMSSDGTQSTQVYREVSYDSGILGTIFAVIVFLPSLSAAWRRLHDTGRAGWLALMPHGLMLAMVGVWFLTASPAVVGTFPQTGEPITAMLPSSFAPLVILGILTLISAIVVFVWLCGQSDPQSNQYGPNPHEVPS